MKDREFNVKYHYPNDPNYKYTIRLKRVNLDERRKDILLKGKGFVVGKPQSTLKKQFKNIDGIFSTRFGRTLQDVNPFADKYKCECGHLTSRIYHGIRCPICRTKVKFVDDDFEYFAFICLKDPYYIIHPNLYKTINALCGSSKSKKSGKRIKYLDNILNPMDKKDINGHDVIEETDKKEPYKGIGLLEFKDKFDEIIDYYYKKNPSSKKKYYEDIKKNKDNIFIQSIPVFTVHLRPYHIEGIKLVLEKTNTLYTMMTKLAFEINNDKLRIFRKRKSKNQLLYDLNAKYLELYQEIINKLASKKGEFRSVFGGRYTFSSRSVIVPDPKLRIDEVIMPYSAMVELLQQSIVNILQKSYNISYADAYDIWYSSKLVKDKRVSQIIKGLIKDKPRGIPILINRNPTISYGGILQMFVVDICDSYTLSLPLQILPLLGADFDGDVLNVLYIINKDFFNMAYKILNPRNAFYISRNDSKLNQSVLFNKDTMINANALIGLARNNYTKDQLEKIKKCQNMV